MKVAFATIGARYTMGLPEILKRIKDLGYDGAEVWGPHLLGRTDKQVKEIKALADSLELDIPQATPYFCFTGTQEEWNWSMAHAKEMAHFAELLGARNVRGLTSVGIKMTDFREEPVVELHNLAPSQEATEEQWEQAVKAYVELTKGPGPVWAIETHGNNLSDSLEGCRRLINDIDSPRLQLTYQWLTNAGIEDGLKALWEHVAQVHLQFVSTKGEERSRKCLQYLKNHEYQGYVTVEFCDKPIWEVAARELAIVKEYL